jgi:hypothetical protein
MKKVINVIVSDLFQEIVCWPKKVDQLALEFIKKGGFPSVCGLIDGTLVNIDRPSVDEDKYVDRHGNHSLNCMMVSGPDHMFYYATSRWPGSAHDSRVLRACSLSEKFESGWRLGSFGFRIRSLFLLIFEEGKKERETLLLLQVLTFQFQLSIDNDNHVYSNKEWPGSLGVCGYC